jgi:hypothetical protein
MSNVPFSLTFVSILVIGLTPVQGRIMIHTFWRLSEAGADNLGLAFTDDGLLLGHTSLIERRGTHYVVRERNTPKPYSLSPLQTKPETARPPLEGEIIPPSPKGEIAGTPLEMNLRLSASRAGEHCAPPPSPCCACLVRWQRISSRL